MQSAEKHPVRGILAGVAGGLVAAWAMNVFSEGPGKTLTQAVQTAAAETNEPPSAPKPARGRRKARPAPEAEQEAPKQDATMKAADSIVEAVTGGRHLTWEQQQKGGPIVHYAFGGLMGGIYGGLAEYSPLVRSGLGTTFGSVLFAGADLLAVPALHLSAAPDDAPPSTLVTPYVTHLVYGITTELVRRTVRLIL